LRYSSSGGIGKAFSNVVGQFTGGWADYLENKQEGFYGGLLPEKWMKGIAITTTICGCAVSLTMHLIFPVINPP